MPPEPIKNLSLSSITATLIDLGLGENEAKLYEILVATPDATIPVLQKKSPFSRTMLYYILQSLEQYELVETKQVGKKTVYNAAAPERLEEFITDQEKTLRRQRDQLKSIIGDLRSAYNLAHNKPGVRFFEGAEGIKEVTFDSLKAQGTICTFADTEAVEKFAKEMNAEYVKERLKRNIPKKILALDTEFARSHYRAVAGPLTEVRLMPQQLNPFKTGMQIYNDTVSYSTLTPELQIGIIIVDKNIAAMHRSLFEHIWDTVPPFPPPTAITA